MYPAVNRLITAREVPTAVFHLADRGSRNIFQRRPLSYIYYYYFDSSKNEKKKKKPKSQYRDCVRVYIYIYMNRVTHTSV